MECSLVPDRTLYYKVASYLSWRKLWISEFFLTWGFKKFLRVLPRRYGYDPEKYRSQYDIPFEYRLPEIVAWPVVFDFPGAEFPGRYYTEALICQERKQPDFPWDKLDESRPLIYCALGTYIWFNKDMYEQFFHTLVEVANQNSRFQWVFSVGSAEVVGRCPDNVIMVKQALQLDMLKRATMMINHGGANSVKECIYFGVPMIVLPFGADHFGIASRVVYHGLGIKGSLKKINVEYLEKLIDTVDKTTYFRSQMKIMQSKFRQLDMEKPAVRLLETILKG